MYTLAATYIQKYISHHIILAHFGYFDANLRTVWRTRYRPKNAVANMFLFYVHFSYLSSTENQGSEVKNFHICDDTVLYCMLMMMKENNITPLHLICILRLRTVRRMSGASPAVVRGWTDWKMMRNLKKWFIMSICVFCKFLIIVAKRCARAETRRQ